MKIKINVENVGYYSIYREPEVVYIELNKNRPHFTDSEIERGLKGTFEDYSTAGERCFGVAFTCIDKEEDKYNKNVPKYIRKNKKPIILSGNKIEKTRYVDGGYLFNRCHLIGLQFRPSKTNNENIIIGTRYFNINGMLPFENKVKEYVDKGGRILYRVKPYFRGNDELAYGVQMEALSIIDNKENEKLHYNVFVYNKQPGIDIDYESGKSYVDKSWGELENKLNEECDCVFNINTKKIHVPDSACEKQKGCKKFYPGVSKILLEHRGVYCKNCYPQGIK